MERFVVGGRVRHPDAEFFGRKAHRQSHRHRIELRRADAVLHRGAEIVGETVGNGEPVIEESEMKFAGFERAADVLVIFARRPIRLRLRMAPRGRIVRTILRLQEADQLHLPHRC